MDPRLDTKDPGFERIRTSSDRTEILKEKYFKTKKLEHFEVTQALAQKVTQSRILLRSTQTIQREASVIMEML